MTEQIPAAGKIGLALVISRALFAGLARLVISPFRGSKGAPTYKKDVVLAMLRALFGGMTVAQSKYVHKPTTKVYKNFARLHKFTPDSITLASGIQAHWIGKKDAKTVLVYFHGGGYVTPAGPSHFEYLYALTETFNGAGYSFATVVLAYTLAPEAEYPTQLAQAAELLKHLVEVEGRNPGDLILAGDSAGGNLTFSLLSHILHPHPSSNPLVPKIVLSQPLRGILAISPWVSFDYSHASFARNAESDMFDAAPLMTWAKQFLGSSQREGAVEGGDNYSEALRADAGWWSGADKAVDDVMIWGGGGEVLIDGIRAFGKKFVEGWTQGGGQETRARYVETPRAAHDGVMVDFVLGYKESESCTVVEEWVKNKL